MRAVDRLKRDHEILRSKLGVLETALEMGPEAWFVLRELCFTLARQLRDHIRREEELAAACRNAMDPKVLAEIMVAHRDEPANLKTINRLFVSERGQSLAQITPTLKEVIRGLRRHMAQEEHELFPIFERVLAGQEPAVARETQLHEQMTVNRVIQRCPSTKPVFERLFINVPLEGCACLDEVAWRHGMEAEDLLDVLEQAVSSCECAVSGQFAQAAEDVESESEAVQDREQASL